MWPTESLWGNAFIFAAVGCAILVAAAMGAVFGNSRWGRRLLWLAPVVLAGLLIAYVSVGLLRTQPQAAKKCIYNSEHPSEC
ncbi:hypothetical protein BH11PSE3_BH11PSE3_28110 [soil metagenome]